VNVRRYAERLLIVFIGVLGMVAATTAAPLELPPLVQPSKRGAYPGKVIWPRSGHPIWLAPDTFMVSCWLDISGRLQGTRFVAATIPSTPMNTINKRSAYRRDVHR